MRPLSAKPRKQRKRLYTDPAHLRRRRLSARLSPDLCETYKTRSLPVRRGDTVTVMRGDYAGMEGKVERVDLKRYRIFVEGLTREKTDGSTYLFPLHPSKVRITRLDMGDKWRKDALEGKAAAKPRGE